MSQMDIVNLALLHLEQKPLANLSGTDNATVTINTAFATVRDAFLRAHPWSFAIKRDQWTSNGNTPTHYYGYEFDLPGDFLRMVQFSEAYLPPSITDYVGDDEAMFKIEGRKLVTNYGSSVYVRYIYRNETYDQYDPLAVTGLSLQLALATCKRITGSTDLMAELRDQFRAVIAEARRTNGIEQPPRELNDSPWITARR